MLRFSLGIPSTPGLLPSLPQALVRLRQPGMWPVPSRLLDWQQLWAFELVQLSSSQVASRSTRLKYSQRAILSSYCWKTPAWASVSKLYANYGKTPQFREPIRELGREISTILATRALGEVQIFVNGPVASGTLTQSELFQLLLNNSVSKIVINNLANGTVATYTRAQIDADLEALLSLLQ